MASARNARKALARGAADESLVLLWNEVEPARLAGDVATLRDIGRIAEQIRRDGDPAQQREAERLLETLRGLTEDETPARPATDALEFSVERGLAVSVRAGGHGLSTRASAGSGTRDASYRNTG